MFLQIAIFAGLAWADICWLDPASKSGTGVSCEGHSSSYRAEPTGVSNAIFLFTDILPLSATTITLNFAADPPLTISIPLVTHRGWFSSTGVKAFSNDNYVAGTRFFSTPSGPVLVTLRNYFIFPIPTGIPEVIRATLSLGRNGLESNELGLTSAHYIVRENTVPTSQLTPGYSIGDPTALAIFAQLAMGNVFADYQFDPSVFASSPAPFPPVVFDLSPLAVTSINSLAANGGGDFRISGTYDTEAVAITPLPESTLETLAAE